MLAVSTRKLTNILNKASRGRFGKEKAEELKEAAKNTFGIAFAKDAFSFQIKQLMQQIIGIGDVLGAIIVSEIGDINRFERPNQLVTFAGLDVTVKQSGEFSGTKNKISKRGSPYLRRAIWLAAQRAAFCAPVLSDYYQSLKARGKHHLTAVGAVVRKLCNIIFVILKENRPYFPTPPKKSQNLS